MCYNTHRRLIDQSSITGLIAYLIRGDLFLLGRELLVEYKGSLSAPFSFPPSSSIVATPRLLRSVSREKTIKKNPPPHPNLDNVTTIKDENSPFIYSNRSIFGKTGKLFFINIFYTLCTFHLSVFTIFTNIETKSQNNV